MYTSFFNAIIPWHITQRNSVYSGFGFTLRSLSSACSVLKLSNLVKWPVYNISFKLSWHQFWLSIKQVLKMSHRVFGTSLIAHGFTGHWGIKFSNSNGFYWVFRWKLWKFLLRAWCKGTAYKTAYKTVEQAQIQGYIIFAQKPSLAWRPKETLKICVRRPTEGILPLGPSFL